MKIFMKSVLLPTVLCYLLLSFVNYSFIPIDWNWVSRFVLCAVGIGYWGTNEYKITK